MAALPIKAHSAHSLPHTEKAARRAARLWFTGTPMLTLASWRDVRCQEHCAGLPDAPARAQAFEQAFAKELASIIAGVSHA